MSDTVGRLRGAMLFADELADLRLDAADEIERLEALLVDQFDATTKRAKLQAEIERLKADNEKLRHDIKRLKARTAGKMSDGEIWNRCDVCGRFIAMADFASGAVRRLVYPDSELTRETWETLCCAHTRAALEGK